MIPFPTTLPARLFRPLFEFVFPPVCYHCGRRLDVAGGRLCAGCWSSVQTVRVEDRIYQGAMRRLSTDGLIAGLATRFYFEKDGPLQSLIHELKYGGMTAVGVELGREVASSVEELLGDLRIAGIIPVPLHRGRLRERGYNQSEQIARGIAAVTGFPVCNRFLRRARYTESQTTLSIEDRRRNVAGAFSPFHSALPSIAGGNFLIVDDVITTGSTICECSRVLLDSGAERMFACSLALADRSWIA